WCHNRRNNNKSESKSESKSKSKAEYKSSISCWNSGLWGYENVIVVRVIVKEFTGSTESAQVWLSGRHPYPSPRVSTDIFTEHCQPQMYRNVPGRVSHASCR